MKRLIRSFSTKILYLLIIAGVCFYYSVPNLLTYSQPENTFEDLTENDPVIGMHIKDDVKYSLDCFSYEETTQRFRGIKLNTSTSKYYYAIPVGDTVMALEVSTTDYDMMEKLVDETYSYYLGGPEPTTKVAIEGKLSKMKKDLQGLFEDYLLEIGYTQEELTNMDYLVIEYIYSLDTAQFFARIGAIFVIIALLVFIVRFIKSKEI